MLQQLQEIISTEAQVLARVQPLNREVAVTPVAGKASVIIGVRRSGKTTLGYLRAKELLTQGVSLNQILMINFFDERLHGLLGSGLQSCLDAFSLLHPNADPHRTIYCFFDEIQEIPGWEPFVDRILRGRTVEVWISGSSAKLLSAELATQMRGRSLSWEIFPFSFSEFLRWRGISFDHSSASRLQVINAFENYRVTGGFPEVVDLDAAIRVKALQEYMQVILMRDVIERGQLRSPLAVHRLAQRLLRSIGSLTSINRLSEYLSSIQIAHSKPVVGEILALFEDAYFFFHVPLFSLSPSKQQMNPRKVYAVDHGLVVANVPLAHVSHGAVLENLVFLHLRRYTRNICYYKTSSGFEVDFCIQDERGTLHLLQVASDLDGDTTWQRELRALVAAKAELPPETSAIIVVGETPGASRISEAAKQGVTIVEAWRYLLTTPG